MEPRFFSILGLSLTREHDRAGLNDPQSHRDDEAWTLGVVPDSLVAAFRASRSETATARPQRAVREPSRNVARSAS
jgi:hypothetical protein